MASRAARRRRRRTARRRRRVRRSTADGASNPSALQSGDAADCNSVRGVEAGPSTGQRAATATARGDASSFPDVVEQPRRPMNALERRWPVKPGNMAHGMTTSRSCGWCGRMAAS